MSQARARIFYGGIINPVDKRDTRLLETGLLAISADGIVDWLESYVAPSELEETLAKHGHKVDDPDVDFYALQHGEWIMPGFVDTHTHAPQFQNLGVGSEYELLEWLASFTFPAEEMYKDVNYAKQAYHHVVTRTVNFGTTTACWYGTLHLAGTKVLADTLQKLGQRAFVGKVNMDQESSPTYVEANANVSLAETTEFIDYVHGLSKDGSSGLVRPIITPRFAIACTPALLTGLGEIARQHPDVMIQTHIAENKHECTYTMEQFHPRGNYTQIYDSFQLLTKNTILAHAIHLDETELELILQRGSGFSHCPTSNFTLRSGLANVGKWLDRGFKVGLGTDCSGGYSASIMTAMKHALIVSKVLAYNAHSDDPTSRPFHPTQFEGYQLPLSTLVYLATMGGAQVCGLDKVIGNFEPGKHFDALFVSVRPETYNPNLWYYASDPMVHMLERFITGGDERNIRDVWVKGRRIGGARQL